MKLQVVDCGSKHCCDAWWVVEMYWQMTILSTRLSEFLRQNVHVAWMPDTVSDLSHVSSILSNPPISSSSEHLSLEAFQCRKVRWNRWWLQWQQLWNAICTHAIKNLRPQLFMVHRYGNMPCQILSPGGCLMPRKLKNWTVPKETLPADLVATNCGGAINGNVNILNIVSKWFKMHQATYYSMCLLTVISFAFCLLGLQQTLPWTRVAEAPVRRKVDHMICQHGKCMVEINVNNQW